MVDFQQPDSNGGPALELLGLRRRPWSHLDRLVAFAASDNVLAVRLLADVAHGAGQLLLTLLRGHVLSV